MKKALVLSLLTGFGMFGCINDNPSGEHGSITGVARIKLPQLPETLAASGPESAFSLTVTVTGPGMQPLSRAWMLSEFGGQTVSFEDIPAGPNRVFTGILMRGMTKTHQGQYTVAIGGGESVFVPLVLRDVATGRAEICVEVEGWPGSPDCAPIDTLPADTSALAGCWHIEADDGIGPVSGTLSLHPSAYGSFGGFESDSGQSFLASAVFTDGAWCVRVYPMIDRIDTILIVENGGTRPIQNIEKPFGIAPDTGGSRSFQFRIRSLSPGPADEPDGMFWGIIMDPAFQRRIGDVRGIAGACKALATP